ncbi:nitroreductase [Burkholderia cenocepacia]|uniref:nitroreductase family protein n=1 Tax=Burkholderia cenocepacia TaxID=95486 RepID=UPI000F5C181B|nr:nitroreductase [Burkholderia cenocepacia]RQU99203.1 nitroreductase [Burkholderia cenocepacia]
MNTTANMSVEAFFETLLSRQSHWSLVAPGPDDKELDLIFDAALRAPDHGGLRPWRFVVVRNEARAELAQVLFDIAVAREPDTPRAVHEQRSQAAYAAPVIVALGAAVVSGAHVPEIEQLLSLGAAAMNLLNAIHALGYGGVWVTGSHAYNSDLRNALDFEPSVHLLGFLLAGTRGDANATRARPPRSLHVREWFGRASI